MPKKTIDYSNTYFYRIVSKDINIKECYVGRTTNIIERRRNHKTSCNNSNMRSYYLYVYQFIRNHGGWTNWDLIEIERMAVKDDEEAKKRERYWIEYYKSVLNISIPSRTHKEYMEENKEYEKERKATLYESNREEWLENSKQYYEENKIKIQNRTSIKKECCCGSAYRHYDFKRHELSKKHIEYIAKFA